MIALSNCIRLYHLFSELPGRVRHDHQFLMSCAGPASILECVVLFVPRLSCYSGPMDISINFILGVLAIAYGLYSFIQRKVAPEKIEKLQTMIDRNGEKMGHAIHLFGYTILPIVAGLLLLHAYFRG